jgi:hypothetical protein
MRTATSTHARTHMRLSCAWGRDQVRAADAQRDAHLSQKRGMVVVGGLGLPSAAPPPPPSPSLALLLAAAAVTATAAAACARRSGGSSDALRARASAAVTPASARKLVRAPDERGRR